MPEEAAEKEKNGMTLPQLISRARADYMHLVSENYDRIVAPYVNAIDQLTKRLQEAEKAEKA